MTSKVQKFQNPDDIRAKNQMRKWELIWKLSKDIYGSKTVDKVAIQRDIETWLLLTSGDSTYIALYAFWAGYNFRERGY